MQSSRKLKNNEVLKENGKNEKCDNVNFKVFIKQHRQLLRFHQVER